MHACVLRNCLKKYKISGNEAVRRIYDACVPKVLPENINKEVPNLLVCVSLN
jgi:hypothetical protein